MIIPGGKLFYSTSLSCPAHGTAISTGSLAGLSPVTLRAVAVSRSSASSFAGSLPRTIFAASRAPLASLQAHHAVEDELFVVRGFRLCHERPRSS